MSHERVRKALKAMLDHFTVVSSDPYYGDITRDIKKEARVALAEDQDDEIKTRPA